MLHRLDGTLPVSELLDNSNTCRDVIDDRDDGIVPVMEVPSRSSFVRSLNSPKDVGMDPLSLFNCKSRTVSFVRSPSSVGSLPVKSFDPMFKNPRFVRFPIEEDSLHLRPVLLRSRYVKWVIPYKKEGMQPPILLPSRSRTDNDVSVAMLDGMLPMSELFGSLICVTEVPLQVTPGNAHTSLIGTPLVHRHDTMLRAAAKLHITSSVGVVHALVPTVGVNDKDVLLVRHLE
jgi:hypothetical protein